MDLPHLDCTTESRREIICEEYEVHADDCIVLYGGNTVRSDANKRIIGDKYYQFSCRNKSTNKQYVIRCGSGAARHLCQLINEPMPVSMNPFLQERKPRGGDAGERAESQWNPLRRQFYNAVQLFIIRYQDILSPGTMIFGILRSVCDEKYRRIAPREFQYEQFSRIVCKFHTTLPEIVHELERYGTLHHYNFTNLANEMERLLPNEPNIFREM